MNSNEEIKEMVKQKYAEVALQNQDTNASSCCGSGGCSTEVYNIMTDDYDHLEGYNPDADPLHFFNNACIMRSQHLRSIIPISIIS